MLIKEVTAVDEGLLGDIVTHIQGKKLGNRKELYNTVLKVKREIASFSKEKQVPAMSLLNRFVKNITHKDYVAAKREYDQLNSLLRSNYD